MKYYVVTLLSEDFDNGAYCDICGIYTDLKSAKKKLKEVVKEEEKIYNENDVWFEKKEYETSVNIYATNGDWSSTIDIKEYEEE